MARIDKLRERLLKERAAIADKPFAELCNFAVVSDFFPNYCKMANRNYSTRKRPTKHRSIFLLPPI